MTTTPEILGFGAVAVDDLLYVEHYPPAESKVRVLKRLRQCGGLTGTALAASAAMGAHCGYAGVLGDDELSRFVVESLGRAGVDFTHAVRKREARPAHSTIIVDKTRKTRTIFASLEGEIGADHEQPPASVIGAARVLLVDHHGLSGTLRAVRIARSAGIHVVADFERRPGAPFDEIVEAVDHLVVSQRFATLYTGLANPAEAVMALWNPDRRAVVVTCGERGAWYLGDPASQVPTYVPAFAVDVVDTTGCGDVFHGVYAACLVEKMSTAERVLRASAAAALKATRLGGQAGIPDRKTLDVFLASQPPRHQ